MRKFVLVFALVLLAVPSFAADRVIFNGSDLWMTRGDGSTFTDFSREPIPAGFFCSKSAPFTGRIAFQGVPLATAQPGALGLTDTIVQRLDDAVFNKRGQATTRIQVRALSLESVEPVKTACGLFKAVVSLDGVQPVTRMRIVREDEKGGRFTAPLALNVRIAFLPVGRQVSNEKLEIRQSLRLSSQSAPWSGAAGPNQREQKGFVLVDTDGDRAADTYLPGTSNFAAGQAYDKAVQPNQQIDDTGRVIYDHTAPAHVHRVVSVPIDDSSQLD